MHRENVGIILQFVIAKQFYILVLNKEDINKNNYFKREK